MAEIKGARSPEDTRALREAVGRIDLTFFGPLFDQHYGQLMGAMDGKETLDGVSRRALKLTADDKIIKRAGMEAVIKASGDKEWSEKHLSPVAKRALDKYALEQEQAQKGAAK